MLKGLRFQKRIKLFPGITINLSKSGLGISAGVRGAHIGIDSRGKKYESLGLPGSGLSYRHYEPKASSNALQKPGLLQRAWTWLNSHL